MAGIKEIIAALGIIKNVPADDLHKIVADVAKGENSERLSPGEVIADFRTEGHVNASPTREEIRVGPSEESSGAGAERMIRHYSNPAPQTGIVLTAETFERLMSPMTTSMKSIADGIKALTDRLPVAKAEEKEEKESDEEEAKAVTAGNATLAKSLIAEAAGFLSKAEDMEDEAEDEEDDAKAKKSRREARRLKKSAALLLSRARTRAYAAKSAELKVQIRTIAAKADMDIPMDDEDKEEKKKAADPAANQADRANADGNHVDAAKAAVEAAKSTEAADEARIKKALEAAGIPMLNLKMNELMDVIGGKSRLTPAPALDITKAKPDVVVAKAAAIPAAVTAGLLTETEASIAGEILNMQKNAEAGNLDMAFVKARLVRAPQAVQTFLAAEAA